MAAIPDRGTFETAYAGKAPWDIGKPQPVFVDAADSVIGSILDAGCGTGENALFFARRGHKVTGIDYLKELIERAKKKAAERGIAAKFLVLDALHLDSLPEQFDSVIDCGLFHVFSDEDRQRYVAGLATVAEPEKDPEKPFQNLAKNLLGAPNYLEAANKFVKAIESCFGQDSENRRKLSGFAGHFKSEGVAIGKALVKDPPDLPSARGKLDRLKPIAAQLQTEFRVGGAILRKAVEKTIVDALQKIVAQYEERERLAGKNE
jgi:SAM-dependent methyltransferase